MELTGDILLNAAIKSLENCRELINEGAYLKEKKSFSRAYTLVHLSFEEIGKAYLCINYLFLEDYKNPLTVKRFLKEFKSHKIKTRSFYKSGTFMNLKKFHGKPIEAIEEFLRFQEEMNNIKNYTELKDISIYTEILQNGEIRKPSDIITEQMVSDIQAKYIEKYSYAHSMIYTIKKNWDVFKPNLDSYYNYKPDEKSIDESSKSLWKYIMGETEDFDLP